MANPAPLFTADWRLDELVPHIQPWSVGVVVKTGSDPRSPCVEDVSLGFLNVPRTLRAVGHKDVTMTGPAMEFRVELRRRPWVHMLGFRGHLSPKSPRDSTTLRFCQARQDWRNRRLVIALGLPEGTHVDRHDEHCQGGDKDDEDTILDLGHCQYRRRRHSPRTKQYGRSIAHDLAESRPMARQTVNEKR